MPPSAPPAGGRLAAAVARSGVAATPSAKTSTNTSSTRPRVSAEPSIRYLTGWTEDVAHPLVSPASEQPPRVVPLFVVRLKVNGAFLGRNAGAGAEGGHVEGFADSFRALYAEVYRAVGDGRPATGYPTFADGHDSMLVCEAVARSSKKGSWVEVGR